MLFVEVKIFEVMSEQLISLVETLKTLKIDIEGSIPGGCKNFSSLVQPMQIEFLSKVEFEDAKKGTPKAYNSLGQEMCIQASTWQKQRKTMPL